MAPRRSPYWVAISGFWVMITMAMVLHDWLTWHLEFMAALRFAGSMWLPWAFVTPAIVWYSTTFPIERERSQWRLAGHIGLFALYLRSVRPYQQLGWPSHLVLRLEATPWSNHGSPMFLVGRRRGHRVI